jgi:hypothetical protein
MPTTMHDTNVIDNEHTSGDDLTKTYNQEYEWDFGSRVLARGKTEKGPDINQSEEVQG